MAQYVSPFSVASGSKSSGSSSSGSKYTSPFSTASDSIAAHQKSLQDSAPLLTPTSQLQADAQKKQQQQNSNLISKAAHIVGDVGGVAKTVGSAFFQPIKEFGKAVTSVPAAVVREVQNKPVGDIQKNVFGTTDSGKIAKKIIGDTAQVGANFVGAGEAGAAARGGEAAATAARATEAANAASKTAKVVTTVKKVAPIVAAGGVSGAGAEISNNPNASAKDVLKATIEGGAAGAATLGLSKVAGKGIRYVFGKKPELPTTPTPISVVDKSTGTTKGTVTDVLPKSTGEHATPPATPRPSSAGYTDGEFRAEFNGPAKQVVKTNPEIASAFTRTGSHDPLTLTIDTLANTSTKGKVGKIVDTMLPGLATGDRTALVEKLAATKDPGETSHLLYDAGHNHAAVQEAATHLTGTPMDKSISFNNPSDVENAQRQQLHVRISQINKAIDAHASGGKVQTPATLDNLLKARQTAQDVLDGKVKYGDAYSKTDSSAPIRPLPFHGEAIEPPAAPKGIVDKLPAVVAGDATRQAVVNRKVAIAATNDTFHEAEATKAWKALSAQDQKLFDKLETPTQMSAKAADQRMVRIAKANAKDPEAFIKYARLHAQDMAAVLEHRQALHPETGQLSNYHPHLYDRTDKATNDYLAARENKFALAIKNGKPGYTQHRIIPTYEEAAKILDSNGQPLLKRANANAHEDYLQTLRQTANENGSAALVRGLKEAHGSSSVFHVGVSPTGENLGNLKISGARGLSMNEQLAAHYNKRAPVEPAAVPNLGNKVGAGYDKLNQGGKNTIFAGGLFHGTQSALTIAGQQFISSIRHPSQIADNLRLIRDTFSPKSYEATQHIYSSNHGDWKDGMSSIERQRLSNLTFTGKDIKADVGTPKNRGILNSIPVVKQAHDMVFNRQLPAAKQMIFDQRTANLDLRNPADLAKAREVAAGLNKVIGGIDNTVNGLSPVWAKRMNRVLIARDYQEGRFSTVGDALTKWGANSPQGRLAREVVAGKAIVTALPGLIALYAAGKLDPSDPKALGKAFIAQLEAPQIITGWRGAPSKSNPQGNPISLKLPATHLTDFTKILAPLIDPKSTYDNNRATGAKDFASSRLAFLPSAVEKLKTNTDYQGNPIFTGKPGESARNVAEQFSPIPVAQAAKTASGKQSIAAAALNEAGLKSSSSSLPEDTAHARRLNEFYNTKNDISTARSAVVKQMNDLVRTGNTGQANRLAQQFNASIDARTMPFRSKYADNYNPAFDKEFEGLKISPTSRAMTAREKAIQEANAVLQ